MKKNQKTVFLVTALITAVTVFYFIRTQEYTRHRELDCTITFVDKDSGKASIEFIDPETGTAVEFTEEISDLCQITINNKSASISDIQIGDKANVKGRIIKKKSFIGKKKEVNIVADEIHITRAITTPDSDNSEQI